MTERGIDTSTSQFPPNRTVPPDWTDVANAGFSFGIARCIREVADVDPDTKIPGLDSRFLESVEGMRAAGMIPGAYSFLDEDRGRDQAKALLDALELVGGPRGILLALDVERGAGVVPKMADIRAWIAQVRRVIPYTQPILVYGSKGVLAPVLDSLVEFGPAWLASYGDNGITVPADQRSWDELYARRGGNGSAIWEDNWLGWTESTFWQFTSRGRVPGIKGDVDLNAFRGTRRDLEELAGLVVPESFAVGLGAENNRLQTKLIRIAELVAE